MRQFLFLAVYGLISLSCLSTLAAGQEASRTESGLGELQGTVVSASRETIVVKSDDNQYHLFVFDRNTTRPRSLPPGTRVRVASTPTDEAGLALASSVTELGPAKSQASAIPDQAPPPAEVRDLEREIKRQVQRWRLGVRAGAALDPELFLFGVYSQIGPIFNRNVSFRPNAEFAFGEVTDLIALNLEATYRLPISSPHRRWSAYVGAGPALVFIHQNFEKGRNIDFGNFDYETGFNVLTGLQFRKGTFFEVKTSLYSGPAPKMRLILGYTF